MATRVYEIVLRIGDEVIWLESKEEEQTKIFHE